MDYKCFAIKYKIYLEQVLAFYVCRATEDLHQFSVSSVPVTADSLESAIDWLWSLDRTAPVSKTATVEATLQALLDSQVS